MKPLNRIVQYLALSAACGLAAAACFILFELAATSDRALSRPVAEITRGLLFALPISCLALPLGGVFVFLPKLRVLGLQIVAATIGLLSGMITSGGIAERVRLQGFEQLALRSRPLADAIRKYESIHSKPPDSLTNLVPDFIPAIPGTGMSLYRRFDYTAFATNQPQYGSNRWFLQVFTPRIGINFDKFLYFPNGQYPERGFGGRLERVQDWAYVHE